MAEGWKRQHPSASSADGARLPGCTPRALAKCAGFSAQIPVALEAWEQEHHWSCGSAFDPRCLVGEIVLVPGDPMGWAQALPT